MKATLTSLFAASLLFCLPTLAANPRVLLETNMGNIEVELFADKAPKSVKNFLGYVDAGHYNGTMFHRVISKFMIQGGGFAANGTKKPTRPPIQNEAKNGLKNERGTLAMARTNVVDSATSQFYINLVNNGFLNHRNDNNYGYAVFGKVVRGMEIVDKIGQTKTGACPPVASRDCPMQRMVIRKASRTSLASKKENAAKRQDMKKSSGSKSKPGLRKDVGRNR